MVKKENAKLLQKRSSVWVHFKQIGLDRAKCGVCSKILSISGGSTSNLKRHFKIKHKKKATNLAMNSSYYDAKLNSYLDEEETPDFENGEGEQQDPALDEDGERKYKAAPKRSPIWIYFNQLTRIEVKCCLCGSIISTRGGGTSNLRRHLRSKHAKVAQGKQHSANLQVENCMSGKSIVRDDDGNENDDEEEEDEEECVLPEVTAGHPIHSEVVVDNFLEIETALGGNAAQNAIAEQDSSKQQRTSPPQPTKPNILKRTKLPAKLTLLKKRKLNDQPQTTTMRVNDTLNSISKSFRNGSTHDTETFDNIATNLGRIATAFERIADFICNTPSSSSSSNQQQQQQRAERQPEPELQMSNERLGARVNEMIIKVLGDEVSSNDVEFDGQTVTERAASLFKCLNLLPSKVELPLDK